MNRLTIWMTVAPLCLSGAASEDSILLWETRERWWEPATNIVAVHNAFAEAHGLGEGGTARFFTRALEAELARPGGGDAATVALALDVLAWSGDMAVTGILHKALFDSTNPYRAQTFYACMIAARSNHTELARDVSRRVPARERDAWYRAAVRNCPFFCLKSSQGGQKDSEAFIGRQPYPARSKLIRANHQLRNYFLTAADYETDPECAWTLYMLAFKTTGDLGDEYYIDPAVDLSYSEGRELKLWRSPNPSKDYKLQAKKKKRLEKRFARTPGRIGENFSLELEYEACQAFRHSFPEESDKARAIPLLKEKFAGLMREKAPFRDGRTLQAHHLRIRETLDTLETFWRGNYAELAEFVKSVPNEHGYRLPGQWTPPKKNTYGMYDESLPPDEVIPMLKETFAKLIRKPVSFGDGIAFSEHVGMISKTLAALQEAGGFTDAEITEFIRPFISETNRFSLPSRWRLPETPAGVGEAAQQPGKAGEAK